MTYEVGSIVSIRDREWIVQAGSTQEILLLSPLGGTESDQIGIYTPLEKVTSAGFNLPDPNLPGDWQSCRLLQDALVLGFRNTAGPFRSFGRLGVDPRPYQFVPLILAMRLDPVRMLIADDVGIGKTVEALLIARELIDRGEADGVTVLCPPHLAEQWKEEMSAKFHIEAELVLGSTAVRLERDIGYDRSLFDVYPNTVVSLDYIKNPRRRDEFRRSCRNLVIVDEAHTCTEDFSAHISQRVQRYELLKSLAADPGRHIILLTATPHSGKEGNFRSLLSLLDKDFIDLPVDLGGDHNRALREKLARHFVQRRRVDIEYYLSEFQGESARSPFPKRLTNEATYQMNSEYRALLNDALAWARNEAGAHLNRNDTSSIARVRWWSALALLHACSSSPAAAAATMEARAQSDEEMDIAEIDELGRAQVLDGESDQTGLFADATYMAAESSPQSRSRKELASMAQQARKLMGDKDPKLTQVVKHVEALLRDKFSPILFCRYISTAEYIAAELKKRLDPKLQTTVMAVTGMLAPDEREARIQQLGKEPRRVLVATDCLSEGINLQQYFDAVIHYDLSWNPTRHEQREGRVDRFGQQKPEVRTITWYGKDNAVDGIVLKTLIRKHEDIKKSLGISVPVPADSGATAEAIMQYLLMLDNHSIGEQLMFEEVLDKGLQLEGKWTDAAERERRSRALFAQNAVRAGDVYDIYRRSITSLGSGRMMDFLHSAFYLNNVPAALQPDGVLDVDLSSLRARQIAFDNLSDQSGRFAFTARFPAGRGETYIMRTHPVVAGLASMVFSDALEATPRLAARRCGVVFTGGVRLKTVFLLLRLRFLVRDLYGGKILEKIAEECLTTAYEDDGEHVRFLTSEELERLVDVIPNANLPVDIQKMLLKQELAALPSHVARLEAMVMERRERLEIDHKSVRQARRGGKTEVHWVRGRGPVPLDVVGLYILMPGNSGR